MIPKSPTRLVLDTNVCLDLFVYRDQRWQRQGLGPLLLGLAVQRCLHARTSVGGYALVVDAKTPAAVAFYAHHGFRPFKDTTRILYLPL